MADRDFLVDANRLLDRIDSTPWELASAKLSVIKALHDRARFFAVDQPGNPYERIYDLMVFGFSLGYVLSDNRAQNLRAYVDGVDPLFQTISFNMPAAMHSASTPDARALIESAATAALGDMPKVDRVSLVKAVEFGVAAGYVAAAGFHIEANLAKAVRHEPAGESEVNPATGKTVHGGQFAPDDAHAGITARIKQKYPNVDFNLIEHPTSRQMSIHKLVVDFKDQRRGVGTAFLKDLTDHADRSGTTLTVHPGPGFGGNVARLKEFYSRAGFVRNLRDNRIKIAQKYDDWYRKPSMTKALVVLVKAVDAQPEPSKVPPHLGKDFDFDAADDRITQELGKAAQQYDDARKDLAEHNSRMTEREAKLKNSLDKIKPIVDAVMSGKAGLTQGKARACLDYVRILAELKTVRQGNRLSYAATQPPGKVKLGGAIGDPVR